MKRAKWEAIHDPNILVVKLAEECGEVAKARLDYIESETQGEMTKAYENFHEELGHVEFIVQRLREEMR